MRHPDDHHGQCDHCNAKIWSVPIRVGRTGTYCSADCCSRSECLQCPACKDWNWLGNGEVIATVKGVFCGERCVAKHAADELQRQRDAAHLKTACRVCHKYPSTPAFTWCCSMNCERAFFAQKAVIAC